MGLLREKKTAVLVVALVMVVLLLLLVLLTFLTQYATMQRKAEILTEKINQAMADSSKLEELKSYRESDEYVIEWAEANGKLNAQQVTWLEENGLWNK